MTGAEIIALLWQYKRYILYAICVILILGAVWRVKSVFEQNEERRIAIIEKDAQIARAKAAFDEYFRLNNAIQEKLRKEVKRAKKNIQIIETAPPPVDGTRFKFMPYSTGLHP